MSNNKKFILVLVIVFMGLITLASLGEDIRCKEIIKARDRQYSELKENLNSCLVLVDKILSGGEE